MILFQTTLSYKEIDGYDDIMPLYLFVSLLNFKPEEVFHEIWNE